MNVSGVDIDHYDDEESYRQDYEHGYITAAPAEVLQAIASLSALVL